MTDRVKKNKRIRQKTSHEPVQSPPKSPSVSVAILVPHSLEPRPEWVCFWERDREEGRGRERERQTERGRESEREKVRVRVGVIFDKEWEEEEEEEEEEEDGMMRRKVYSGANPVNEEDPEHDRATQV